MPNHNLATLDIQDQVDFVNYTQKRVAAEVLRLEKKTTLALLPTIGTYELPADIVQVTGIINGTEPLTELGWTDLLGVLSGGGSSGYVGHQAYAVLGRTLYVLPVPAEVGTLTLLYLARSADFDSPDELELTGESLELFELLLDAEIAFDRGETEIGSESLQRYEAEAAILRVRWGMEGRARVLGPDIV